jgi:hypothetical protein
MRYFIETPLIKPIAKLERVLLYSVLATRVSRSIGMQDIRLLICKGTKGRKVRMHQRTEIDETGNTKEQMIVIYDGIIHIKYLFKLMSMKKESRVNFIRIGYLSIGSAASDF